MAVAPAKLIVYPTIGSIRSHEKYEQFFLIKSNNLTDLNENQQNWLEKPGKKMEVKNLNFVFGFFFLEKERNMYQSYYFFLVEDSISDLIFQIPR